MKRILGLVLFVSLSALAGCDEFSGPFSGPFSPGGGTVGGPNQNEGGSY